MRESFLVTVVLTASLLLATACQSDPAPFRWPDVESPTAAQKPKTLTAHGEDRVDEYYWLNDREDPEVLDYLNAENSYTDAMMADLKPLEEELFAEIKGRIKQDDTSVPYKADGYFYYTRFEEGKQYPIYCRKKGSLDGEEQIMLNGNKLAEGHDFYQIGSRQISTNQQLLAYAEDSLGRRIYTLRFKNLETGEMLADEIPNMSGNVAWANDNKTVFYTVRDLQTLRAHRVYRHTLGSNPSEDVLVFDETDEEFSVGVGKTKSKKYLMIGSSQTLTSEYLYLDANNPSGKFKVLQARERGLEYSPDHYGEHFYIRTNLDAENFRLMRAPVSAPAKANWEEVIAHRDDVLFEGFEIFKEFLVLDERKEGLTELRIRRWDGEEHYLEFGDPTYAAYISVNRDYDTKLLRYVYSSLTTPSSTYDYNMASREQELLKRTEVLGGFDPANYESERLFATARDGERIPVSLVYRKGTPKDGSAPLMLYAYGSYGSSRDASFSSPRISLLDRGWIYAIAHIRGGQEMGRYWYEDGKLLKKMNTFTDFIDVGQDLLDRNYTREELLFARGGSAGGLLMGVVANLAPDMFQGIVADVPFVDVVTTMLDDTIPLTTFEYDEWGNPNDEEYYRYMLSYSPYDNVEAKEYTNMLVTTGLHDSQVQYWEPAKWVARLRAMKTDDNVLLLKTDMEAGHGGASGRFDRYKEVAFRYAFLLTLAEQGRSEGA